MGSYGIKVAEPDYDVRTAEEKDLSLKSGLTLLKVFAQDSIDGSPLEVVSHNLGYEPQFLVWVSEDAGLKQDGAGLATGMDTFAYASIDNSDLTMSSDNGGLYKYFIFYEQLEDGTAPAYTPTNSFGIKISKDGVDVDEANILEQTFNSELNSLKIIYDGSTSGTVNTLLSFNITHGLGYTPGYLLFFEVDGSGKWWSENETDTLSGKNVIVNSWTTDSLLVSRASSSASCTVKIRYYILADKAT